VYTRQLNALKTSVTVLTGQRKGLTLLEILTVIAVVGILFSLIIPAVFSAREAARNTGCMANLRQIGIALASYHTDHGMFTPNSLLTSRYGSSNRFSGLVYLLPYIEQNSLFDSINMSFCSFDQPDSLLPQNLTAKSTRVSIYLCPSDGEPNHKNSYRYNHGCSPKNGPTSDGPFSVGIIPSQSSVTDGLSNTAFVSERLGGNFDHSTKDSQRGLKYVDWPYPKIDDMDQYIVFCVEQQVPRWNSEEGKYWFFNGMENGEYNHYGHPNDARISCGGSNYGLHPPRSMHGSGVNVLYGDTHVQYVSNTVNMELWRKNGTHASND